MNVAPIEQLANELEQLARRISRIRPQSHTNPHTFYEDRSEVAEEARAIARRIRKPEKS